MGHCMPKQISMIGFKRISSNENDKKYDDLIANAFGEGNLTEDVLEKWINESKIDYGRNDGQVDYNKFLHKMANHKKNKPEEFLFGEM